MPTARRIALIGVLALAGALVAVPLAGAANAKVRAVPKSGLVKAGSVRCDAAEACVVKAMPKRVEARVAGRSVKARVAVPSFVGAGGKVAVGLRFGPGALERLAGHTATFRAKVLVRGSGKATSFSFQARLKRPASPVTSTGGSVGGAPAGTVPHSEAIVGEPAVFARPSTAETVEGVTLTWYPRDSFVAYLSSGTGTEDGVHGSEGATTVDSLGSPCPVSPSASAPALPYQVNFTPRESWFDPATGLAAINGTGSVLFRYKAHTIDLVGSEPEIQINGTKSLAIFRFSGSEGTPYPNQRVSLESLTPGQPTITNEGRTYTYSQMRATLTPDGEKVFAGFYPSPNNAFGCLSASFTLP